MWDWCTHDAPIQVYVALKVFGSCLIDPLPKTTLAKVGVAGCSLFATAVLTGAPATESHPREDAHDNVKRKTSFGLNQINCRQEHPRTRAVCKSSQVLRLGIWSALRARQLVKPRCHLLSLPSSATCTQLQCSQLHCPRVHFSFVQSAVMSS